MDNQNLNDLTTLILWDDYRYSPIWMGRHCTDLRNLRLVFTEAEDAEDYFWHFCINMNREPVPWLRVLSVCCDDSAEKPKDLQKLEAARPMLRVYYNTDELAYDLLKLPV